MTDPPETNEVTNSGGNQQDAPIRFTTCSPALSNQIAPSSRSQVSFLRSSLFAAEVTSCRRMSWTVSTTPQAAVLVTSEEGDWSTGICDCCQDKKQCCFAFWCGPCFACRTTREFGQCLCLPLLDALGCVRPIAMSIRVSLRQRYGIRGSLCSDCLCSTFCLPCVWCQMATEMEKRKLPTVLSDIISQR